VLARGRAVAAGPIARGADRGGAGATPDRRGDDRAVCRRPRAPRARALACRAMTRVLVLLCLVGAVAHANPKSRDFTRETRAVYAVAACGEPPPEPFDKRLIA